MHTQDVQFSSRYKVIASLEQCNWVLTTEALPFGFTVSKAMVNTLLHRGSAVELSYIAYINNVFCVITEGEAEALGLPKRGYSLERVYNVFDDLIGWTPRIPNGAWVDVAYHWDNEAVENTVSFLSDRLVVDHPVTYQGVLSALRRHFSSFEGYGSCRIHALDFGPKGVALSQRSMVDLMNRKYPAGSYGNRITAMLEAS